MSDQTVENVKEYYGKTLQSSKDLKTSACCTLDALPKYQRDILKDVEDEVIEKFYGCGSPIPLELKGKTVLDLGCGTGRDVYVVSKLVGQEGKVIGIDMTDAQLQTATKHVESHMKRFGFSKRNVVFTKGYIERLSEAGIKDNSVDVVISNCVINLSANKEKVFKEIFRVLKPGGELYFSDIFASRRIPHHLKQDATLYGECLSGALYIEDFRRMLFSLGVPDFRIMSQRKISLDDDEVAQKAGMIDFYSMTVRAFKLELEDKCEDYGQVATYRGTVEHAPQSFVLDDHHEFETGKPMLVCGNTAAMISQTRFGKHFKVDGDTSVHYGLFECGDSGEDKEELGGCC